MEVTVKQRNRRTAINTVLLVIGANVLLLFIYYHTLHVH